jgi:hypothetical protein
MISKADYKKVVEYGAADLPAVPIEQITAIRVLFADNLVGRSQMTWDADALDSMARLLPGCPFTVNHDWYDIDKTQGVIYDAKRLTLPAAPEKFLTDYAKDLNKQIIAKDGWMPIVGKVALFDGSEMLEKLSLGSAGKVSIGGFRVTEIWCPLCKCSFHNRDICSHVPPSPWYDNSEQTAPYTVRKDVCDMGETSLVLIPNAPSAGVITNDISRYFEDYAL